MARRKKAGRERLRLIRSKWVRAAAGLALWAGGSTLSGQALAQSPSSTGAVAAERAKVAEYHLNKQIIQLPIQLDDKYRPMLKEIHLYVKDQLSAPWKLQDKAPPTQTTFTFRATKDGPYWFTMVTVDLQGRQSPDNITREEPAMLIVVDTQPPQPELTVVGNVPEGQLLHCEVRDAHLDPQRTRVQYQTADKIFRDLEPMADRPNTYCIPGQANITGQIRVMCADLAGNLATRECNLSQLTTSSKTAATPAAAAQTPITPVEHRPVPPTAPPVAPPMAPPMAPPVAPPAIADQKAPAPVGPTTPNSPTTPNVAGEKLMGPQLLPADKVNVPAATTDPMPTQAPTQTPTKSSAPVTMPPAAAAPLPLPSSVTVNAAPTTGSNEGAVPQGPPLPMDKAASNAAPTGIEKVSATVPAAGKTLPKDAAPAVPQVGKSVPPAANATVAAKREGTAARHLLVNSTHVFLEYRIEQAGASGVGRVEIWCTRDKGETWQKLGEDQDRKSPAEVHLPGDGLYGLTLVVSNGLGFGAQPPAAGDVPDWWIEVDTTQPVAQITSVRLTTDDGPAVCVGWSSQDKNLGNTPVELSYAVTRQGPWLPIAKNLKGDGQLRWVPPLDIGTHAFLRLTVHDLAGNTTITETTQPVALDDLSRPRAVIANVSTDGAVTPPAKSGDK
jgi:hypothetical protein